MGGKEQPREGAEIIELFPGSVDQSQASIVELLFSGLPNEDIVDAIARRIVHPAPESDTTQ